MKRADPADTADRPAPRHPSFGKSIAAKLVLVTVLFLIVPVVLYWRFQAADLERRNFMLDSIRAHGTTVAQALADDLGSSDPGVFGAVAEKLALFGRDGIRLRLLFNPREENGLSDFYYVASSPTATSERLDEERQYLKDSGILSDVWSSCTDLIELTRLTKTSATARELVVSITPIQTAEGCWVLIDSLSADAPMAGDLVDPYWKQPEVMAAALVYLAMAMVLLAILIDLRVSLRRFERLARSIAAGGDRGRLFQNLNRIPELDDVARQFDAMVQRQSDVAAMIRGTAEEQVHSMKTPIGTIAQSLEALRPAIPKEDERAHRMLRIIDQSRHRLTHLIVAGQRATEAAARMAAPPRTPVQIDEILSDLCADFQGPCEARGVHLKSEIETSAIILGSDDMIETVLENVIENAVSFSPKDATVQVTLRSAQGSVRIVIHDEGPGAEEGVLENLFDKGFTKRPAQHGEADAEAHFGLGMWIVRRNIEALGGSVTAANRTPSGLEIAIELPTSQRG